MRFSKTYKHLFRHLFTVWVALHTLNYSVDIDAVLFSQANYSTEEITLYDNKVESFFEIFVHLLWEGQLDDLKDNPFSQNESKSFIPKVFTFVNACQIIYEAEEAVLHFKEQLDFFYLDQSYPTPTADIIPPPPRVA
ncbi:hypothetical protein [Flammeovirga aprica]|uniref:Uncharacterized protein n=1 Tax=Flammeovirga aprica JL-4 TaxID=694437 RepID=A0A7X9NZI6_9BACT|nr:hypothetical protein [Flammeovirga aprica]NME66728.1 hypothetical protein [Flammeovirga aprica JL-4]